MLTIQQIKLSPSHTEQDFINKIAKACNIRPEDIIEYHIKKRSIDARKKKDIKYIYTVNVKVSKEKKILSRVNRSLVMPAKEKKYHFPMTGEIPLKKRPLIIGTGPAGLFCGLLLARHGFRPILLERGEAVEERVRTVEAFWNGGRLNTASNVQFGEGGAGTFSDGKLNTLVKDTFGRNQKVLEIFVEAGAPSDILYVNKPHIGTDILVSVVKNMREEILSLGGEIFFNSQVTDINVENYNLSAVTLQNGKRFETDLAVLAIGHSARDTFALLQKKGLYMEAKAFAVGLRIEHPQALMNVSQYGEHYPEQLPPADYKLTYHAATGRGMYSFCMCPGGFVVDASSEENKLAINGMSYRKRDGQNANSAMIVTVSPKDFPSSDPLSGVAYQRRLEEAAYVHRDGAVPIQLFEDFCNNQETKQLGDIMPQVKGKYQFGNLREILPDYISETLIEGITQLEQRIQGFSRPDTVLSGVESRTSSPVRIVRDSCFESNVKGIYPCGEGAGYAGGIMSAAMDGMKIAEAISKKYGSID